MKKSLVVLLIAVLATSLVFAGDITGFTGYSDTQLVYDVTAESFALEESLEVGGAFSFTLDAAKVESGSTGSSYPYAVVDANMSVSFPSISLTHYTKASGYSAYSVDSRNVTEVAIAKYADWCFTEDAPDDLSTDYSLFYAAFDWAFTKAEIVGENWSVDFLHGLSVGNYAVDTLGDTYTYYEDTVVEADSTYGMYNKNSVSTFLGQESTGVTFKYGDYKLGVGLFTFADASDFSVAAETPVYEFTDGLTAQVGLNATAKSNNDGVYGLSGKVDYAVGNFVFAAAADGYFKEEKCKADVSFAADYSDIAEFDFYYASKADAAKPYSTQYAFNKANYDFDQYTGEFSVKDPEEVADGVYVEYAKATAYTETAPSINYLMSVKGVGHFVNVINAEEITKLDLTILAKNFINNENISKIEADFDSKFVDVLFGVTNCLGDDDTSANPAAIYFEVETDVADYADIALDKLAAKIGSEDMLNMKENDIKAAGINGFYASVEAAYADITATFKANRMLGEGYDGGIDDVSRAKNYAIELGYTGLENHTFGASAAYSFDDEYFKFGVNADYAGDMFTATAKIAYAKADGAEAALKMYAKISSDKIVDNATIYASFGKINSWGTIQSNILSSKLTDGASSNTFKVGCKIAF